MRLFIILFTLILLYPFSGVYSLHVIPDSSNKQNEDSISVSLQTGFMYGNIGEYVYSGEDKISELDWDTKPLIYIGNVFTAELKNNISAGLGYWFSLNSRAGNISDTDYGSAGEKVHYSNHDSVISTARFFDIFAGYNFNLPGIRLLLLAGYSFKQFVLEARNGYSEDVYSGARFYSNGIFIQYEQKYHIPYAGITMRYPFTRDLYASLSGTCSGMVFCRAEDNHISRSQVFYDNFEWGRYYSAALSAEWIVSGRLSLAVSCGYYTVLRVRGDTYSLNKNTGSKSVIYKNGAGMSFDSTDCRIAFKYFISHS